jgi:hypothetical protein
MEWGEEWIHMGQDMGRWWVLVNIMMKFWFHKGQGIS